MKTTQKMARVIASCLLALVLVGAVSCSEEDDRIDDPIVGTWQMRSFLAETTITVEGITGTMTLVGRDFDGVRFTFHADGTSNSSGTYTLDITTTMAGQSTTTSVPANPTLPNGGTWQRNGNTLTVNHPDNPVGPQGINIMQLDDELLHLMEVMPPVVPVPGLGDIAADIRFTRVD